ncbi:periplasmic protein [Planctomycetes bacterium Poly30]|uniref:Periplasmic protein n=1 Tax=Saltatorellus ferox TaxID=2528018 RepID=A0A518EPM9_9BACT|nr:periplasmic protein [Planctomycetes bacterium Poly30]
MSETNPSKPAPVPSNTETSEELHARSLHLAYGDLDGSGNRYSSEQFRAEPHVGASDDVGGYYEALSESTVRPFDREGAGDPPATLEVERSDAELVAAVKDVLGLNDGIDDSGIEVECSDGVINLTGKVADRAAKLAADETAIGVLGVKDVMNNISCT